MIDYVRFDFYTTPLSLENLDKEYNCFKKVRGIYTPPENECKIIRTIQNKGYAPTINATYACTKENANGVCGLVFLGDQNKFVKSKEYTQGRIFCHIWWQKGLSDYELDIAQHYFSRFFRVGQVYYEDCEKDTLEFYSFLQPPEVTKQIGGSYM